MATSDYKPIQTKYSDVRNSYRESSLQNVFNQMQNVLDISRSRGALYETGKKAQTHGI